MASKRRKSRKPKGRNTSQHLGNVMRKAHIHENEDLKRYNRKRDKRKEERNGE